MWLLYALLAPAFYAIAEEFDNFLANKKFSRHPLTLVFFTSLFNLLFIVILWAFDPPQMPPLNTIPIFILLGFAGIGYLYPYYKGLQSDDTSVVISFFGIGRIFIPVLAFLIVGELLHISQYFGILLVIFSVTALGLHHTRSRFRISKAVWYIGLAAILIAFESVLLKLLFENGVSVSTAIIGESTINLFLAFCLLFVPTVRKDVQKSFPTFLTLSPLFLIEEIFTFFGYVNEAKAISLTSVSVVKGITMIAPFYLILYAWVGRSIFPKAFKEDLHRRQLVKKLILFAILITGLMLVPE